MKASLEKRIIGAYVCHPMSNFGLFSTLKCVSIVSCLLYRLPPSGPGLEDSVDQQPTFTKVTWRTYSPLPPGLRMLAYVVAKPLVIDDYILAACSLPAPGSGLISW